MSESMWLKSKIVTKNKFDPSKKYDVIIIGAGIAGLSCAYWLQKSSKNILVVDRGPLGIGASGRNAGFLTGGSINYFAYLLKTFRQDKALEKWSFTTNNVKSFKEEFDLSECEFIQGGTISLFDKDDDIEELYQATKILKNNGFDVEITQDYFNREGIHIKTDAMYDPYKVLVHLYQSLESKVDFAFDTEVTHVDKNTIQTNDHNKLQATKVIMATNYSLTQFLDLPIKPQRSQIAYYECDNSKIDSLNFFIPSKRIYFRKYQDGIIIGGLRMLDPETENTGNLGLNEGIQEALRLQCEELFGESKLNKAWSGIMGFTEDEQPLLGEKNGIYYLGGFSGHGNGYAFTMARELINNFIK
jgi:gamma-glutamylputrescine oxidase